MFLFALGLFIIVDDAGANSYTFKYNSPGIGINWFYGQRWRDDKIFGFTTTLNSFATPGFCSFSNSAYPSDGDGNKFWSYSNSETKKTIKKRFWPDTEERYSTIYYSACCPGGNSYCRYKIYARTDGDWGSPFNAMQFGAENLTITLMACDPSSTVAVGSSSGQTIYGEVSYKKKYNPFGEISKIGCKPAVSYSSRENTDGVSIYKFGYNSNGAGISSSLTPWACASGYHLSGNLCEKNEKTCPISQLTEGVDSAVSRWVPNGFDSFGRETGLWGSCEVSYCKTGYSKSGNSCVGETRSCKVDNGLGAQSWDNSIGAYSQCAVVSCSVGFHIENGSCVSDKKTCSNPSTFIKSGSTTWDGQNYGQCSPSVCEDLYYLTNGSCEYSVKSCSSQELTTGVSSALKYWNYNLSKFSKCSPTLCSDGYVLTNGVCLSESRQCSVLNGTGTQTWNTDSGSYGTCIASSCSSGFHLEEGLCSGNKKSCSDPEKRITYGYKLWDTESGTYGQCNAISCDYGFKVAIESGISVCTPTAPVVKYSQSSYLLKLENEISITPTITGSPLGSCGITPDLPQGLSLNTENCSISGLPNTPSSRKDYTITATGTEGTQSVTAITIEVLSPPELSVVGGPSFKLTKDSAINPILFIKTSGIMTGCSVSPGLPTGLIFNASNCTISGTPSSNSTTTTYSIKPIGPGGESSLNISIEVATVRLTTNTISSSKSSNYPIFKDEEFSSIVWKFSSTPTVDQTFNILVYTDPLCTNQISPSSQITSPTSFTYSASSKLTAVTTKQKFLSEGFFFIKAESVSGDYNGTCSGYLVENKTNSIFEKIGLVIGSYNSTTSTGELKVQWRDQNNSFVYSSLQQRAITLFKENEINCNLNKITTKSIATISGPSLSGEKTLSTLTKGQNDHCVLAQSRFRPSGSCPSSLWSLDQFGYCVITSKLEFPSVSIVKDPTCLSDEHLNEQTRSCEKNTRSCSIDNGRGFQFWADSSYSICTAVSCVSGFHLESNQCLPDQRQCSVSNGTGIQSWLGSNYSSCIPLSCNNLYSINENSGTCEPESCSISDVTNSISVSGNKLTGCFAEACTTGYSPSASGTCEPESCSIVDVPNSITVSGNKITGCFAEFCSSGYSPSASGACEPESCSIVDVPNSTSVSGNKITGCIAESCSSGYELSGGSCNLLNLANVSLTLSGTGLGSIDGVPSSGSSRLSCPGVCSSGFEFGSNLAIQANPNYGSHFSGFSGDLDSLNSYESILVNNDKTINATFTENFNKWRGFNGGVKLTATQSDGKIIFGGSFTTYNGTTVNRIVRLNPDGSIDSSFNTGAGFNNSVKSISLQSDGKIIVWGSFTSYNGETANYILRLNSDGTKDSSFNTGAVFGSGVASIALQPDGKIIAGKLYYFSVKGMYIPVTEIIRLNSDGSIDNSFFSSNFSNNYSNDISISIQSDNKIIIGGSFSPYSFEGITLVAANRLVRLNSDGSIDSSFYTGTGFGNGEVRSVSLQTDGKILVGGTFSSYNKETAKRIVRLNSDGTKDSSFNSGTGFDNQINSITLQGDGKILAGGFFTSYNGETAISIVRLNSDGTKDSSFNSGIGFNNSVLSITLQPNGKIITSGNFTSYNNSSARYIALIGEGGNIEKNQINGSTGFDNSVLSISVQDDGKILAGGSFSSYNGTTANRIVRLNSDGTKDSSFNSGTGFNDNVISIVLQSDGKIIVGGSFTTYNGTTANKIVRLNPDGSIDSSFNTGTGFNGGVSQAIFQSDGSLLVGGSFTTYNGTTVNRIVRLDSDGSIRSYINLGTGFNNTVSSISEQADGKIIVGGSFTSFNGTTSNRIVRLNYNLTKDTSFNTGAGSGQGFNGAVSFISPVINGQIIVGGAFTSYKNGATANKIVRLNSDGSVDSSFNTGTGFNENVVSIVLQSDGKILAGGRFTTYNGTTANRIIRLNSDGSIDSTFNTGTGFNGGVSVASISLQEDGKILTGGSFTSYKDIESMFIIRLNTDGSESY